MARFYFQGHRFPFTFGQLSDLTNATTPGWHFSICNQTSDFECHGFKVRRVGDEPGCRTLEFINSPWSHSVPGSIPCHVIVVECQQPSIPFLPSPLHLPRRDPDLLFRSGQPIADRDFPRTDPRIRYLAARGFQAFSHSNLQLHAFFTRLSRDSCVLFFLPSFFLDSRSDGKQSAT